MLETRTASKPASAETFIRSSASLGSDCRTASSTVATRSRWPSRMWPGFGSWIKLVLVVGEVVPAPVVALLVAGPVEARVIVVSLPPPSVKPIAIPATAAAPSRASAGPFQLTGGHLSGLADDVAREVGRSCRPGHL